MVHTILALSGGKHVVCEKPLADNYQDAREMYALAEEKGLMLVEAMWTYAVAFAPICCLPTTPQN